MIRPSAAAAREVVADEPPRRRAAAVVRERDVLRAVRAVAAPQELAVDDRVLAGAHVLGEPADAEHEVARVRAVRGRAVRARPTAGPGATSAWSRKYDAQPARVGVPLSIDPVTIAWPCSCAREARGEAARRQLDVRAGERDVVAARDAHARVARPPGQRLAARARRASPRELLAHDLGGPVGAADHDDHLERRRALLARRPSRPRARSRSSSLREMTIADSTGPSRSSRCRSSASPGAASRSPAPAARPGAAATAAARPARASRSA